MATDPVVAQVQRKIELQAPEDLAYLLEGMGWSTGGDLEKLFGVSRWLSEQMGAELPGLTYKAGGFGPIAS